MRSTSDDLRAAMARAICVSTRPPINSTPERMPSISTSNCLEVCSFTLRLRDSRGGQSAEAAGDVILGFLAFGLDENLVGGTEFDQLAQVHVSGKVRNPRRLLHIVGDDGDRVVGLELADQLLDLCGRDRIQRR